MDNNSLNNKKYEALPSDALVNITVSGRYYHDLKTAFNNILIRDELEDNIGNILDNLAEGKITSHKEHTLYVMFTMIAQIEKDARIQGVTVQATTKDAPTL